MKTITIKPLLVTLFLAVVMLQGFAQTGTRIDVQGTTYSDVTWIFTLPSCTHNFDNGYDGYKMFSANPALPQIYVQEPDGSYQIDAIPDVNNTYLTFVAGIDTTYTLTFTSQYLANYYQSLYLVDSVTNQTTDIYTSGTTYKFTASNKTPIKRFKIVTSIAPVVQPVTPTVEPVVPPIEPVVETVPAPTPIPKLSITNSNKIITVINLGKDKGKLRIIRDSGKIQKTVDINAKGTTIIDANVPAGNYILNAETPTQKVSITTSFGK
jgi:hypothetical protein